MTRVLVTGGTGFIGRHLVQRLVERGDQVRCLIRQPNRQKLFAPLPVECASGDVTLPDSLDAALRDIEVVYHLAGATLVARKRLYRVVNTEGTRNLSEVCARQPQPPIFVYVSSVAAAGPAPQDQPLTEEVLPHPVSEYGRSKLAAEHHLRTLASRLPVTVLRPPSVFGPGDRYTVKLFRLARRGLCLIPGSRSYQLSWVYVGDLVEAILLATERGQRLLPVQAARDEQGLYFIALDDRPTLSEAARMIAEAEGCRFRRTIHVPAFLCWIAARLNDLRTRITGRTFLVNPDKLREALAGSWICSPDRARRELGFTCRTDLATGFRLTGQWYHDQGWL